MSLIDLRGTLPAPMKFEHHARPWSDIKGVTIHQTGCLMGEDVAHWHDLDAHIGVTRGGQVFVLQPFTTMIWHGNGLSPQTIGIEFEGINRGIPGWPLSYSEAAAKNNHAAMQLAMTMYGQGNEPLSPPPAQLAASEELYAFLSKEFNDNTSCEIFGVWGHRQSSNQRQCDPGYELWQQVAKVWRARMELPVGDLAATFGGGGEAIPREWDSDSTHSFWGG